MAVETTPAFFKYFSRCERPILTSCERCERTRSRTNARIGAKDRGESRSSVMDRPSRRGASKADKAAAAASQLKSLREKGTKRLDTVEDLEDNDVYTSVRTRGTRFASPMPRMRSRERASASRTRGRIHRGRPVDRARRERGAQRAKLQIPRWCQQQGCQKKDRERTSDLTPPRPLLRDAPQMTEEEYAKFANERRQKYGGFVVGEEGDEYVPTRPDGFQIPSLPRGRLPTSRLPLSARGLKSRFRDVCRATPRGAARRGARIPAAPDRRSPVPYPVPLPLPSRQVRRPRRGGRLDHGATRRVRRRG